MANTQLQKQGQIVHRDDRGNKYSVVTSVSKGKPLSLPTKSANRRKMHNSQVCWEQCHTLATQESPELP